VTKMLRARQDLSNEIDRYLAAGKEESVRTSGTVVAASAANAQRKDCRTQGVWRSQPGDISELEPAIFQDFML